MVVHTVDNWQNNGRPWSDGFHPRAILVHHTASARGSGNFPSLRVVTHGRSDVPGPLSQFLLGRNGEVYIITGEGANHGGTGGPIGVIRKDMANYDAWGIEAENDGIGEPWPEKQIQAYYRLCAALMQLSNIPYASRIVGHKEYTSRKIDPNGINMSQFRDRVRAAFTAGTRPRSAHRPPVKIKSFHLGNRDTDIVRVKNRLNARAFASFNMSSSWKNHWGRPERQAFSAWQKSLGLAGKEIMGIPTKYSLNQLGLNVVPNDLKPQGDIWIANVGPGKRTNGNRRVKRALRDVGLGGTAFTGGFGRTAQRRVRKYQDQIGQPHTELLGRSTLEALGFKVLG